MQAKLSEQARTSLLSAVAASCDARVNNPSAHLFRMLHSLHSLTSARQRVSGGSRVSIYAPHGGIAAADALPVVPVDRWRAPAGAAAVEPAGLHPAAPAHAEGNRAGDVGMRTPTFTACATPLAELLLISGLGLSPAELRHSALELLQEVHCDHQNNAAPCIVRGSIVTCSSNDGPASDIQGSGSAGIMMMEAAGATNCAPGLEGISPLPVSAATAASAVRACAIEGAAAVVDALESMLVCIDCAHYGACEEVLGISIADWIRRWGRLYRLCTANACSDGFDQVDDYTSRTAAATANAAIDYIEPINTAAAAPATGCRSDCATAATSIAAIRSQSDAVRMNADSLLSYEAALSMPSV